MSALVLAFKRPEPAPAKPADTRLVTFEPDAGREIIAFYLDDFDGITRCLFDDDTPVSEKKALISRWRGGKNLEPLDIPGVTQ